MIAFSHSSVLVRGAFAVLILSGTAGWAAGQSDEAERVAEATIVLGEIMETPDQAIPDAVYRVAEAIAVFPSTIKGGFIVGAQRGRGIISVRNDSTGTWSPPAFLTLTGGSFGLQIGAQSIDIILVVMNRRGLENLLRNQFTIGADASVAAGPVGRAAEASTDIQLRAEILSYSRARGLFAGVTMRGSAITEDTDANEAFYGQPYRTRAVVLDGQATSTPYAAYVEAWQKALASYVATQ